MSAVDDIAAGLAERFALRAAILLRVVGFGDAAGEALAALGTVDAVVGAVVEYGGLAGAGSGYAVVAARLRRLPLEESDRTALAAHEDGLRSGAARIWARRRAAQLALLVHAGELPPDAARWLLAQEIEDGSLLAEVVRYVNLAETQAAGCQ